MIDDYMQKPLKILSIAGARPQFIKVAALQRAIAKKPRVTHLILHTGQHYDYNMSAIFFKELQIPPPDFHLDIHEPATSASLLRMTLGTGKILAGERPDMVIVYGDTNSTLAGARAAKKLNFPLAHVEAGLRSYDYSMPEEINRVETDKLSNLLFCPTITAKNNLLKEGFADTDYKIILSGDIMLDTINYYAAHPDVTVYQKNIFPAKKFILCTLHRQSLMQSHEKLAEVIEALNGINKEIEIIMPAHPRFKKVISEFGLHTNFKVSNPVGYLEMISLLQNCTAVITDSGGLQKEAFFCKKPCITVRNETEWTELVLAGVNFIAGDSSAKGIMNAFSKAMNTKNSFEDKFYGNGDCAEIIVESVLEYLRKY